MDVEQCYGITVLHQPEHLSGDGSNDHQTVFELVYSVSESATNDLGDSLVAIHGLNGHPLETWTHEPSRKLWLRDLLPQVIPNIRIMTYGYNAKFWNFTAHQDLRHISQKLLADLVDFRTTTEVCKDFTRVSPSERCSSDDDLGTASADYIPLP